MPITSGFIVFLDGYGINCEVKSNSSDGPAHHMGSNQLSCQRGFTRSDAAQPMGRRARLAFIERMEPGGGGVVVASRQTMREILGCSMPTVERALRTIINEGWAQRIRIGGANALAINARVAWVGPRGDLPQAVFSATVIASRAEQDAIALDPPPVRAVPFVRREKIRYPWDRA